MGCKLKKIRLKKLGFVRQVIWLGSTEGLTEIKSKRVQQLCRTAVPRMCVRLGAMRRSMAALTGLNRQSGGYAENLSHAVRTASHAGQLADDERKELLGVAQDEIWAKHRKLGCEPDTAPDPWFFYRDEDATFAPFRPPDGQKMTPGAVFETSVGPFHYRIRIDAENGDTGVQENLGTGKRRQLVRGRANLDADRKN